MCDLAASKLNHRLYPIPLIEESDRVVLFEGIIVIIGVGPEFKLLHLNDMLLLLSLVLLLLLFVLPLAVIHGLGYRRFRSRGDQNQIKSQFLGLANSRGGGHDFHRPVREDGSYLPSADCFVDIFSDSWTA